MTKSNKEHTLIVWSNQESVEFFMVPNEKISRDRLDLMLDADGRWINADENNAGMTFLNNALCEKKEYCFDGDVSDYCIFKKFKVKNGALSSGCAPITRVISSGFCL